MTGKMDRHCSMCTYWQYAEGFIECEEVYPGGASFFQGGNELKLTDEEIEKEVWEDGRKES